jgi:hypothetical protein
VRAWSQEVNGIPTGQVIASSIGTNCEDRNAEPTPARLPEIDFIDDRAGKPVGINQHIGCPPIAAFGNSDGDFRMLEWVMAGPGPRRALIVDHDDAGREFAYDRKSHAGRHGRGLDEGPNRGWSIASMKNDWNEVHPDAR